MRIGKIDVDAVQPLIHAAVAYGVVEGEVSYSLTDLGQQALQPKRGLKARREAVLRPRVFGNFLRHYDGKALPSPAAGEDALEALGVPTEQAARLFEVLKENGQEVGIITKVGSRFRVNLPDGL